MKTYTESELLELSIAFHGHLGPYLVLGLKAGKLANKIMVKDPFNMRAEVFCPPKPPHSCIVDGIQFSTGCTMGKGNITMHSSEVVKVIFTKKDRSLEISPKRVMVEQISSLKEDAIEDMSRKIYGDLDEEIFDYDLKPSKARKTNATVHSGGRGLKVNK